MEQADLKKEYDDTLSRYTQKRSETNALEKEITSIKIQIEGLRAKLAEPSLPVQPIQQTPSLAQAQADHQELLARYLALNNQVHALQAQHAQKVASHTRTLQQHQQSLSEIEAKANSSVPAFDASRTKQAEQACRSAQEKAIAEEEKISQLKREIEAEERVLQDLQREIDSLHQAKNSRGRVEAGNQAVRGLEEELALLEKEEKQLEQETAKKHHANEQAKHRAEGENKQKLSQLEHLKQQNSHTKTLIQKIHAELSAKHHDKNDALDKEIKEAEDAQRNNNKEIDALTKQIAAKKEQEALRKEQAKKEKNKDKRNFKQEIVQEQKLGEMLAREYEREKSKLEDTIKLRKTYVGNENLQILQKEHERHQLKNKPNLQAEQARKDKTVKEQELIKSRIQFLKQSTKGLQNESEKLLKDLRGKGDELVKEKLASQKVFNDTTYKLNEYMKEFPDHEKKKEEAKNEEKRRRHEAKIKAQEEKEKEQAKRKKAKEEKLEAAQDPDKPEWEKWDEWDKGNNLPKRDEKSVFNNRQFQLIAAAVAIIAILGLSFS